MFTSFVLCVTLNKRCSVVRHGVHCRWIHVLRSYSVRGRSTVAAWGPSSCAGTKHARGHVAFDILLSACRRSSTQARVTRRALSLPSQQGLGRDAGGARARPHRRPRATAEPAGLRAMSCARGLCPCMDSYQDSRPACSLYSRASFSLGFHLCRA